MDSNALHTLYTLQRSFTYIMKRGDLMIDPWGSGALFPDTRARKPLETMLFQIHLRLKLFHLTLYLLLEDTIEK